MRAARDATIALGAAVGVALAVALVGSWREAAAQEWLAAGYLRLVAAACWHRFDRVVAVAAPVALLAIAAARLARFRGGGRAFGPALALVLVVAGLRLATLADAWRAGRGPNVLLISIDTLRADRLGAYGYDLPTSPTVDRRLAAEGVTFEEVYAQSPKTTPSHMTMLTSLPPCVHGVLLWDTNTPGRVLNPAVHTLAEVLKNAGWATAAFTGGSNVHRSRGFGDGFDEYRHSDQLARATDWITRHRGRKWFVFFHTFDVHDPYLPPEPLIARFDGDYRGPVRDEIARLRAGADGWERAHELFWASVDRNDPPTVRFVSRLYDAAIRHMDETTIAPLLDLLDRLDLARDTLVVFTSDHGEAFGEHGRFLHEDLYRGTLRVPLILRFPGRVPAGTRSAERARLLDVMPTILALVGVDAPRAVEGRSLVQAASESVDVVSEHDNVALGRIFRSVRRGPLAYIVDGPSEHLFDLVHDPGEADDLAARRPTDVAAMRAVLDGWHAGCEARAARLGPTGAAVQPDAATLKRLRALGYVE